MKILKSITLIAVATAVMVVFGLFAFLSTWVAIIGLYSYSRLAKKAVLFSDWSWSRFLVTLGFGLVLPYVVLLVTAGF